MVTTISEEHTASAFRLKMKAICFSEMLVTTYKITQRHNPEDHNWHLHHCENLKSQKVLSITPVLPWHMCEIIKVNDVYRHRHLDITIWCTLTFSRLQHKKGKKKQGQRIFLLAPASRLALGTQPPIQWVPGVLSPGVKRGRGVTLTTHPHLVPKLSMSWSYTSSPPMCLHGM
jgi:hypothetical protein